MHSNQTETSQRRVWLYVGAALAQALLFQALQQYAQTVTHWPDLFAGAVAAAIFGPLVPMLNLGRMRPAALCLWTGAAGALAFGLGWHIFWRDPDFTFGSRFGLIDLRWAAIASLFFVVQSLIDARARAGRWLDYRACFDAAWRLGALLALAALFTGALWATLRLAAALFRLLDISLFTEFLADAAWGISSLAFAAGLFVAGNSDAILKQAQSLVMKLLSWLTILFAPLVSVFLLCLPPFLLQPAAQRGFSSALLIGVALALIFLVNCCYGDGDEQSARPRVLRWSARLAAFEIAPLTLLAAWAIFLRVDQYGWSANRIVAMTVASLACLYGLGYFRAAFSRDWLKPVERTNLYLAFINAAVALAMLSPLADPARLTVAWRMAQLRKDAVAAEKFDFGAMRFNGGRWGQTALEELSRSDNAEFAKHAKMALATKNAYELKQAEIKEKEKEKTAQTWEETKQRIDIAPPGAAMAPELESYLKSTFDKWQGPLSHCRRKDEPKKCVLHLPADGQTRMAILSNPAFPSDRSAYLFRRAENGDWIKNPEPLRLLQTPKDCATRPAPNATAAKRLAPLEEIPTTGFDIRIGDDVYQIDGRSLPCPKGP